MTFKLKLNLNLFNCFVSPGAKFGFAIDIIDLEAPRNCSNTRYGLVAIDKFTKIAGVVPIKNATPEEIVAGLKKMFESMGKPKQLYSDESSMRSANIYKCLNGNAVKSIQTTIHAHTVERYIRTFRYNLYRIFDSLKQYKREWVSVSSSIKKCKSTEHEPIQINLMKQSTNKTMYGLAGI